MALYRGFFNQCCFTGMLSKKVKKLLLKEIVTKRSLFYIQNKFPLKFSSKRITLFQRKLLS